MEALATLPDASPALTADRPAFGNQRNAVGRAAFLLCGLLLLAAAALKLVGWNVAPFAQYGWLLTPTVQTAAVVWEAILGIWLLASFRGTGGPPVSALHWLLAVLTFAAFAAVSGYLGLIGQANCGCFGLIQASPWAAFGVDLAALVLLALGRPAKVVGTLRVPLGLIGVAIVLATLAGVGTLAFGSLDAAIAKLRGEPLGVTPAVLDFGQGKPGELLTTSVTVRNFTTDPVRLIGGTSDCSCLVTQDLPVTIPPGESVNIAVRLKVPGGTPGQLTRRVEVFTDCRGRRTLVLTATCRVTE